MYSLRTLRHPRPRPLDAGEQAFRSATAPAAVHSTYGASPARAGMNGSAYGSRIPYNYSVLAVLLTRHFRPLEE